MKNPPLFYSPTRALIIDTCQKDPARGDYSGKTLAEFLPEFPDAIATDLNAAWEAMEASARAPVTETTAENFQYALEALPPKYWKHGKDNESFQNSEKFIANITSIFARVGVRYFVMMDNMGTPHDEIIRRCRAYMEANR